ncbi:hypothetical protein Nepgr_001528 [Nepenthes gracilis]|uniref:Pentatricopeptide repeat-containing protein n=1 Tax=Nepenthes gracilis TaxID=150966 RepID=A0AAD3RX34_NEPGR|nr:hypothetical protein Nepgr_001528 [Nepenthes gracilis]
MRMWDVITATAIIGRSVRCHRHQEAIYLFSKMLVSNIRPNEFTFGTLIPSSTALRDLDVGKQLHACAIKIGLQSNIFVGSALVDLYTKLSNIEVAELAFDDTHMPNVVSYTTMISGYLKNKRFDEALNLFQMMPEKNVVSWNAMISGLSQMGQNEEATNLFINMMREGSLPDHLTFPCAITAAANIASLGMGRGFHGCAVKVMDDLDVFVGNSLISFYARCGSIEDSVLVFKKLNERTVVSWNSLIYGYAKNGRAMEALELFKKMKMDGFHPNGVTILGLLMACNHAGLVEEGLSYFNMLKLEYPRILNPTHYSCMVDLLSRSGRLGEAERFLVDLPFRPGIGFWKALLGGCQIHSNKQLGEFAVQRILALDPADVSSYIMISNVHSVAGRWQCMSIIRREMWEKAMKRIPGCSWIEIRGKVHNFVTRDQNHCQKDEIYMVLKVFLGHINSDKQTDLFK